MWVLVVSGVHADDCDMGVDCGCDSTDSTEVSSRPEDMADLSSPDTVEVLREVLDLIDDQIVALLQTRLVVARTVLRAKSIQSLPTTVLWREEQIFKRLSDLGLPEGFVRAVWAQVFQEVKRVGETSLGSSHDG